MTRGFSSTAKRHVSAPKPARTSKPTRSSDRPSPSTSTVRSRSVRYSVMVAPVPDFRDVPNGWRLSALGSRQPLHGHGCVDRLRCIHASRLLHPEWTGMDWHSPTIPPSPGRWELPDESHVFDDPSTVARRRRKEFHTKAQRHQDYLNEPTLKDQSKITRSGPLGLDDDRTRNRAFRRETRGKSS